MLRQVAAEESETRCECVVDPRDADEIIRLLLAPRPIPKFGTAIRSPVHWIPAYKITCVWKMSQIDTSTAIGHLATVAILAQGTISG